MAPVLRRRTYQSRTACSSSANSARPSGRDENSTRPVGVEHRIGIEAVVAGIERPHLGRDVEGEAAVGLRPQEARDGEGLAAQGIAVQAVGRLVQQIVERQRHQHRGHADRHDVEGHDAADDRAKADHPAFSSAIR